MAIPEARSFPGIKKWPTSRITLKSFFNLTPHWPKTIIKAANFGKRNAIGWLETSNENVGAVYKIIPRNKNQWTFWVNNKNSNPIEIVTVAALRQTNVPYLSSNIPKKRVQTFIDTLPKVPAVLKNFNKVLNQRCRHRLNIGGTNVPPPICKFLSDVCSSSHLKLTNNNPKVFLL